MTLVFVTTKEYCGYNIIQKKKLKYYVESQVRISFREMNWSITLGGKKVEYNTEQCQFAKFSSTCTPVLSKIFIAYFGSVFGKVIKCLNNDIYGTFTAVKFDLNNM